MPFCEECGKYVDWSNAISRQVANSIVHYHRYCTPPPPRAEVMETPKPKQEKPAAKKVVVPHDIATSTAKGTKGWKNKVRRKYGPEVLAAAIGRH